MSLKHIGKSVRANVVIIMLIIISIICKYSVKTHAETLTDPNRHLVWADEFNSSYDNTDTTSNANKVLPNPKNWNYEEGYERNKEWQYYTKENLRNAYCQDGKLHIVAIKDNSAQYPNGVYKGQDGTITSASLTSKGKVENQYGWLEIRAKIDTRLGSWPAFWNMGVYGEWPDCGECDVMEYYQNKLLFNTAWWLAGDQQWTPRWDSVSIDLDSIGKGADDGYHIWAMEWTPSVVRLYLDGVLMNTWDSSQDKADGSIQGFLEPHYMIINQAIGGTVGGDASNLKLPTDYVVDYVRWYDCLTKYPNGWVYSNNTWHYYQNGVVVKNDWARDSYGWCFLNPVDGSLVMEGWAQDSHGWCYIQNGYWVNHAMWARDSTGWCHIGDDGYWDGKPGALEIPAQ